MKYAVVIVETLCRTVTVEADNENDAMLFVKRAYDQDEIELDARDWIGAEITDVRKADEGDWNLQEVPSIPGRDI